jgi:hypothetical protein
VSQDACRATLAMFEPPSGVHPEGAVVVVLPVVAM